jgi:hypothetical protein
MPLKYKNAILSVHENNDRLELLNRRCLMTKSKKHLTTQPDICPVHDLDYGWILSRRLPFMPDEMLPFWSWEGCLRW